MIKKIFILFLVAIVLFVSLPPFETLARQEPLENRVLQIFNLSEKISTSHMIQVLSVSQNREFIEERVRKYEFGKNWKNQIPVPKINAKEIVGGAMLGAPLPVPIIEISEVSIGIAKIGINVRKALINEYLNFRRITGNEKQAWNMFVRDVLPIYIDAKRGGWLNMAGISIDEIVKNPEGEHALAVRTYFSFVWEAIEMSERRGVWTETRSRILTKSQRMSDYLLTKPPSLSERIGGAIGDVGEALIGAGQSIWRGVQNVGQRTWDTIQRIDLFGAGVAPIPTEQVPPVLSLPTQLVAEIDIAQVQKTIDELTKQIDALNKKTEKLSVKIQTQAQIINREEEQILAEQRDVQNQKEAICSKDSIEINSAPEKELLKIIGVGQVRAIRIVEARPFCSLDDLSKVLGIGDATLQRIKEQGCAYVDAKNIKECEIIVKEKTEDEKEDKKDAPCLANSIDINSASKKDLEKITNIGPARADNIIAARPFSSVDDLLRVSGIGTTTLQRIKDKGCAYVRIIQRGSGGGSGWTPSPTTPVISATPTPATDQSSPPICFPNSININSASKEDLDKITRIGPSLANKIIAARPFSSLDDLLKISGIATTTLQRIKDQGCAYVVPVNQPPIAKLVYYPPSPFVNQEIIFNASQSNDPDGQIASFIWDFGDGRIATTTNPTTTHKYSTSSTFLVQLTVNDNQNATSSATTTIMVSEMPQMAWSQVFERNFGGQVYAVQPDAKSDGYVITGRAGGLGAWFIKTSATGTYKQSKTFHEAFETRTDANAYSVQQTTNGDFVITGRQSSQFGQGGWWTRRIVSLIKFNEQGERKWGTTFGPGEGVHLEAHSIQQTVDGGFILAGSVWWNGANFLLLKTSATGTHQWSSEFGVDGWWTMARSIQQTRDRGFIVAGKIMQLRNNIWDINTSIIKTSADGIYQWSRLFGGPNTDIIHSVQQTADDGFILAGQTNSSGSGGDDFWLVKINSMGEEEWSRTFGGMEAERAFSVLQTTDGGFILAGQTNSFGFGSYDFWLVKTDINGNKEWSQTFGGTMADMAYSVLQTADGGFIVAGQTDSFGLGNPLNVWLIKVGGTNQTL